MVAQIRQATAQDDTAIRSVAEAAWWPTYRGILADDTIAMALEAQYTPASLAEQREGGVRFLVAELAGEVQAFVACSQPSGSTEIEAHKLYVHPHAHGQGLGAALLQAAITHYPTATSLGLLVNRRNAPALKFYLRQGLRIVAASNNRLVADIWKEDYRMQRVLVP